MFIVTRLAMLLLRIMIPLIPLLSLQTMSALLPYALLHALTLLLPYIHDLFVVSVAAADLGDCTVLSGSVCSIDLTNIASLSDAVTSAASSCVLAA